MIELRDLVYDLHPDKSGLDPKLAGTDVPTFNPPLRNELKATPINRGGRLFPK
jgi:hypothetical protein